MRRARVLLTAYACQPGVGSEPGAGWNWVRLIAERHEVWLITRRSNVAAIELAAGQAGLEGLRVIGFDLPRWASWWRHKGRGATLYFYLWQLALVPLVRRLSRQVRFDLAHHLTFVSSWAPSGLAWLGIPFVWGPIGRHPRIPDRFLEQAGLLARVRELVREALLAGLERCDPLLALTRRRAARILVLSRRSLERLPASARTKTVLVGSVAVEPLVHPDSRWARGPVLRVFFAGRLVDLKGVRLAVEAFGRLASREPDVTLTILGRGPLEGWIRRRLRALGLTRRVELLGHLPHAEARARLRGGDVFLFPSFEGAGMAVLEAMAAGCAVVCLAHGGPGEMVGEGRGLAVPLAGSAEGTVAELARALMRLERDEGERRRLARAGWHWACREQSWEARAELLERVYGELLPETDGLAPRARRGGHAPSREAAEAPRAQRLAVPLAAERPR